jgi:hypothetical protein
MATESGVGQFRRSLSRRSGKPFWGFLFFLAAIPVARSQQHEPVDQPLFDIVAVGRGRGQILLATLAAPPGRLQWRFRRILVSPPDKTVSDVSLSANGTKALVTFGDGTPRVFDLTKPITEISTGDAPVQQHRLPSVRFPYVKDGEVCLLDDLARSIPEGCSKAAAAAVRDDGLILYVGDDGQVFAVPPRGEKREVLPYRIPPSAEYQLLAGQRGDTRDFLLLVTQPVTAADGRVAGSVTTIIDPHLPASPLGQYANARVAALRALLSFRDSDLPVREEVRFSFSSNAALETLITHLDEQTHSGDIVWSFYRVGSNPNLYAPVLEFADDEPDYPTSVDSWNKIRALAHGNSTGDYRAAYASLGDERWSRCTYYVRTLSYPGTWLIEYWFYYPFDEGRAHPHIHDSEHLFVEVDKLGGTVRNVFASDHDSFVPNNLFSTLVRDAPPVALPLFATIEFGKHAMAPDIDHDGRFVRGIDDNLHNESYSYWGLRDQSTKFHFMMEPYLASMTLPRHHNGRFALKDARVHFANLDVPAEHQVCSLQSFPDDPPCSNCRAATAEAASSRLIDHPDARNPEAIYKPYVVPWSEIRIGAGIFDWSEGRGQFTLAYAGDFRHMTGGLFPIPARLAVEYGWTPFGRATPMELGGQDRYVYSRMNMYAGLRVERLITNTQGFYFAATPKWARISSEGVNSSPSSSPSHWQFGSVSYHFGYVLELPSAHHGNFTNHIGFVVRDAPSFPLLFEWRVSLGILRRRGRHDFGARLGDRNPYQ